MEPNPTKPLGRGSILALRIRTALAVGLLRLVMLLVDVIRWLFAPLVVLLQLLLMVPYARQMRLQVARGNFQQVDGSQLPEDAWIYFQETASVFGLIGFRRGPYVRLNGPTDNQTTYGMPLIHDGLRIGMGVNLGVIFDVAGKTVDTRRFVELTGECDRGQMLDFTNSTELEPFMPANRTRMRLPELGEIQLLHLFTHCAQRLGCTLSDATLAGLRDTPDVVMWEEFHDGMQRVAAEGYLAGSGDDEEMRTTWKGALQAGLFAQWPLSVLVARRRERATDGLLAEVGMSRDDADLVDIASLLEPLALGAAELSNAAALCRLTDALAQNFSAGVQLATVGYYYDGSATGQTPESINCTYVLRTSDQSRALLRRAELQFDIEPSTGRFNWVMVEDAHYGAADYDAANDADLAQPLSVAADELLPLQRVIELSEPLLARHAETRGRRNDILLIMEENGRTLWHRQTLLNDGDMIEIDLDGVSGEILRDELVS